MRQRPAMQSGSDESITEMSVTTVAQMVMRFAQIIVFLRPIKSKSAPVRILPIPLQTESTPTSVTASDSAAPTESDKFFAELYYRIG